MRAAQRIARLRALLEQEGLDAVVVRSVTDLMWLTGFERVFDSEQAHTAVVTAQRCIIHTDSRYATAMNAAAGEEGLWEVDATARGADGAPYGASDFVGDVLAEQGCAGGSVAIEANTPLKLYRKLAAKLPGAALAERDGDILKLRAVKEPGELELMRRAQQVADSAFTALLPQLHAGMSEREVSLKLEFLMREGGADELAFPNIVASGPNGANPHAVPGERLLQEGELVVIDFGARVDGYRSDTTRTICVGHAGAEQRRIYEAVRVANEAVEKAIRPGVSGRDMHELAEQVLAEYGFAGKMGHGLGHGVGLDIHELPNNSPRNEEPHVAGNVVTIEPGAYLPGVHGVRLEDCGVLTDAGFENFCTLPHALITVG